MARGVAWLTEIQEYAKHDVVLMLLGNKASRAHRGTAEPRSANVAADSTHERVVRKEQGERLAKEFGVPFMETSARSGLNVELAFTALAKELRHRSAPDPRGKFKLHDFVSKEVKGSGEALSIQSFLESAVRQETSGRVRVQRFIETLLERIALAERLVQFYQEESAGGQPYSGLHDNRIPSSSSSSASSSSSRPTQGLDQEQEWVWEPRQRCRSLGYEANRYIRSGVTTVMTNGHVWWPWTGAPGPAVTP
ncbi:hypothetical protein CRUP_003463 [Coryphaenoides rupestris]|nr:hypothetical protein CRUP_003463 [Coryphaenoides rupestris]